MSLHESSYMENGNTTMGEQQYKKKKGEERTLYFQ